MAADAKLFTPPTYAMSAGRCDKNYEFWGNQTFLGENPPQAAVISWFQKKPDELAAQDCGCRRA